MTKNWYVRVPRYMGWAAHPRYWEVVSADEGSEEDTVFRTELIRNGAGELVPTVAWYFPVPDEESGQQYIEENFRKWDGS